MSKIGIITIVDNNNYGNRLQNLAVIKIFEDLGYHPETLVLNQRKGSKKYILRAVRMLITPVQICIKRALKDHPTAMRIKKFKRFNVCNGISIRYLPFWTYEIKNQYKYFVVGSDQIWNPTIDLGYGTEFLSFADKKQRVCFSPSFGVSNIPENKYKQFKEGLAGFEHISVRENSGVKIVYELTGKDAEVLVDPTLIIEKDTWCAIEKKPSFLEEKKEYIFEYFLGGCTQGTEDFISFKMQNEGFERVNVLDKNSDAYCTDPAEFVYLIHHASAIATDSFHAAVFSIIFGKEFMIWDRIGQEGMRDRIVTLLELTRAIKKESLVDGGGLYCTEPEIVDTILGRERIKVTKFLKESMGERNE